MARLTFSIRNLMMACTFIAITIVFVVKLINRDAYWIFAAIVIAVTALMSAIPATIDYILGVNKNDDIRN
jgi:hypothetical protein